MAPEISTSNTENRADIDLMLALPKGEPDFGLRPKPTSNKFYPPKEAECDAILRFLQERPQILKKKELEELSEKERQGQPSKETCFDFRRVVALKIGLLKSELKKLQELKQLRKEVTARIKSPKLNGDFIYADINIIPEKEQKFYPKILVFDYAHYADNEEKAEEIAKRHEQFAVGLNKPKEFKGFPFPKSRFDYWDTIRVTFIEQICDGLEIKDIVWAYDYKQKISEEKSKGNSQTKIWRRVDLDWNKQDLRNTEEALLKLTRKIENPTTSVEPLENPSRISEKITNEACAELIGEANGHEYKAIIDRWKLGII